MLLEREEFGLELYAAIQACAEVQQLLHMISIEVGNHRDPSDLSAEYGRKKEAAKVLVQHAAISDEDAGRLLREYPWLKH